MTRRVRTFIIRDNGVRQRAAQACLTAPEGDAVSIGEPTRSLEQNAAQWPILEAFAEQLLWPVDAEMVRMTAEEWKDVLTAAFKGEKVRLAKGLYGGVVMLGLRTSKFGKNEFSEWLDFLNAVAVERGVNLEPATA